MPWSHIILEAYCGFGWKDEPEFYYKLDPDIEIGDDWLEHMKKIPNPKYDPKKPKSVKPEYCPGPDTPCNLCYENECPYLCTCTVDEDDYEIMMDAWEKKNKPKY
jgi:hypothetical protein